MTEKLICSDCKFFDRQMPPINDIGYCLINGIGHKEDFECTWQEDYQKHKSEIKR